MNKNTNINYVFYYQDEGEILPGTEEDFKKLTGASWAADIQGDLTAPYRGISPSPSDLEMSPFLLPVYESFRTFSPPLYIRKGTRACLNTLHAQDQIPKGTVVTEYLGAWEPEPDRFSSYRWGPINGLDVRNYGGMIDDGFPNVSAFYLFDCCRAPLRVIFVALETIPANGVITTNYGMSHSVKVGYHFEYRKEGLIDYFSKNTLIGMTKAARNGIQVKKKDLSFEQIVLLEEQTAKLQYLFHTPSALLCLLLENVLTVQEVFNFYDKIDNRLYLLGFYAARNSREKEIGRFIEMMRKYFNGNRDFDPFIRDLMDKVRIQVLFCAFIAGILEDGNGDLHFKEALLWDACIDYYIRGDDAGARALVEKSKRRDSLLEACRSFKNELAPIA